ncbi:hypothetical protein KSD_72320 [Ktedonobacter sp. SOSP1-85]|uniref:hypothetical protein n=1 Tax=Ktedonobacter sp. SOSP1-85 TaxID=2778367 RepID=UPI001914F9CC|nr:hypothetical protein [Ktedonobacter sp. SOSP1-85]GHO79461.1 hypothetical protein KSD_72320 [Ktedonobacter sp. SOSP1-85]
MVADEAHVFPEASARFDCAGGEVEAGVDWWERQASAFLHISDQRSLQPASRSASMGFTFLRSQGNRPFSKYRCSDLYKSGILLPFFAMILFEMRNEPKGRLGSIKENAQTQPDGTKGFVA